MSPEAIADVLARRLNGEDSWTWNVWPVVAEAMSDDAIAELLNYHHHRGVGDNAVNLILLRERARRATQSS